MVAGSGLIVTVDLHARPSGRAVRRSPPAPPAPASAPTATSATIRFLFLIQILLVEIDRAVCRKSPRQPSIAGRVTIPGRGPLSRDSQPREPAIRLAGLRRDYGERTALDGVGLTLAAGESLVVLGPNGAGKTTLLRILATLLRPSGGEAVVLGCSLPGRGLEAARPDRLPRPRAAALPRPQRPREPALPRPAARDLRRRRPRRGSPRCSPPPGWSAAPTSASPSSRPGCASGWRSAAASCTSRSCCCSTSPTPTSTPRGASWRAALIGPGGGRTRVVVTHDPERFLPEADQVLRRLGGSAATARRRGPR